MFLNIYAANRIDILPYGLIWQWIQTGFWYYIGSPISVIIRTILNNYVMKKMVLSTAFCIAMGLLASAQTERGNWLAGGNVELNTAKNDTRIMFTPSVGYFFANNFAGGANISLDYAKTGTTRSSTWGIGPFARYYFGAANVRPLIHGNVDFTSTKNKVAGVSNTFTGTNYFLGAGLAAFINRNVALEGLAGYSHTAYENQTGTGGFRLKIGFQAYLSHRQVANMTK